MAPAILCLHGWPQNHREFLPFFETCSNSYRFIAPDLRGYADSDKPYTDYLPATIAQDMLELADVEGAGSFHVLSHDLGGPPSVALAYMAGGRSSFASHCIDSARSMAPHAEGGVIEECGHWVFEEKA